MHLFNIYLIFHSILPLLQRGTVNRVETQKRVHPATVRSCGLRVAEKVLTKVIMYLVIWGPYQCTFVKNNVCFLIV